MATPNDNNEVVVTILVVQMPLCQRNDTGLMVNFVIKFDSYCADIINGVFARDR
jgi:hypothetical protein